MKNWCRYLLSSAALLLFLNVLSCADLKEKQDKPDFSDPNGQGYPYYLVIGGGLSETLSVLRVEDGPSFRLYDDVALTDSAINQTVACNQEIYAVCSLSNSVVVYDDDLNVLREVSVGEGVNPMAMAITEDDQAWISGFLSNDVRLISLAAGTPPEDRVQAVIAMPDNDELPHDAGVHQTWARPNGVASAAGRLFVALSNLEAKFVPGGPGQLAVIDPARRQIVEIITLEGRDPIGLALDDARQLVWVVSAGDYDPGQGFAGNGLLEGIDVQSFEPVERIAVDGAPFEVLPDGQDRAYLGNGMDGRLLVVDLKEGRQLPSVDLRQEKGPTGLSFISALAQDPAGRLYVTDFNSDRLYVLDPARDLEVIASFTANDGPDTLVWLP